jgi:hypothetical protein
VGPYSPGLSCGAPVRADRRFGVYQGAASDVAQHSDPGPSSRRSGPSGPDGALLFRRWSPTWCCTPTPRGPAAAPIVPAFRRAVRGATGACGSRSRPVDPAFRGVSAGGGVVLHSDPSRLRPRSDRSGGSAVRAGIRDACGSRPRPVVPALRWCGSTVRAQGIGMCGVTLWPGAAGPENPARPPH